LLRTRLLTAAVLVPIAGFLIYVGGLYFLLLVTLLLTLAEVEFCQLMGRARYQPNLVFGIALLWVFLVDAQFPDLGLMRPGLACITLASLAWQLLRREGSPVANWSLTVAGGLYLGVCGAALVWLRGLPQDGLWWTATVVPAIMIADSGAYFIGKRWGRHKLAPTLSPGKTWEGYIAGIVTGGLAGGLLISLWLIWAGPDSSLDIGHGLVLGVVLAIVAPLGDLAVSMIKRYVGAKDTGRIIPGHGGALDRVDSVLWAAVIGYYYVVWFVVGS
jgi:phosphatidate cytidylyltransferase